MSAHSNATFVAKDIMIAALQNYKTTKFGAEAGKELGEMYLALYNEVLKNESETERQNYSR